MDINNKVLLVSGGDSGLGKATAKMILDNKGFAILVDINEKEGRQTETEMGKNACFVKKDVTNEESVKNAI